MAFDYNPYITRNPLPPASAPVGVTDLNNHLNKYYAGGQSDPLGLNSPTPQVGPDAGAIAAAGAAGLGLVGGAFGMAGQSSGVETQAPDQQYSATGEPVYNTGEFFNQSQAKAQGATGGEVLGSTAQGALAGVQFGPVGAAIGGAFGLATSLIGGRVRRNRQQDEIDKARRSAVAAQETYNTSSRAFDEKQNSQFEYLRRMDNTNRIYNLYSA